MPTDLKLYALVLPNATQEDTNTTVEQQVAKHATLDKDTGASESTGTSPSDLTLQGLYGDQYAEKMATELEELSRGSGESPTALYGLTEQSVYDGYYRIESATVNPPSPQTTDLWEFTVDLTRAGTKHSAWRAIATTVGQPPNDFGNDLTAYIGVNANATKVRWYNPTTQEREEPTLVETRNAQLGDVEIYDATASSFYDADTETYPTLIFELDYVDEGDVAPRVWDDRGNDAKLDGDGDVQWQKVLASSHDFIGKPVVENKLLRLTFDESSNALSAETWNDGTQQWDSTPLGTSDWELYDLDIRRISQGRVDAHVEFRDPTASPTEYYTLHMSVKQGYDAIRFTRPGTSQGSTPGGLQTLLDPIADTSVHDPQESWGLVSRSDVTP